MERVVISLVIVILILINFTIIKKLNDKNKRLKKDGEKKVELIKSEAIQLASKKDNIINNLNINSNKLEEEVKKNYITISLKEKLLEENTKTIALKNDLLKNEKIEKDELKKEHEEYIQKVEEITSNDGEAFVKSIIDSCVNTYSGSSYPQVLHNVIFRKHDSENYKQIKDKFNQIDHLIISIYGLLAIETKFHSGTSYIGIGHDDCLYTQKFKTFFPNLLKNKAYSTQYSSIVTVREYEKKKKSGHVDTHYEIRKSTPLYQVHAALKGLSKVPGIDKNVKSYKVAILVPSELNYISEGGGNKASLIDCRNFLKDKNEEYVYALGQDELRNHIKKFLTGQLGDPQFREEEVQAYVNKLRSI